MTQFRLLDRKVLFTGRIFEITRNHVDVVDGPTTELDILEHPGAAAVLALDANDQVTLVRQFRFAAGGDLLEIPAGKRDDQEDPEICARRELAEETGLLAERWTSLGWVWTTPGFTDERLWLYLAEGLTPTPQRLDADEVLVVETMPLAEALDAALDGRLTDAKTVVALVRAQAVLKSRQGTL